jgi:hypothetical protein
MHGTRRTAALLALCLAAAAGSSGAAAAAEEKASIEPAAAKALTAALERIAAAKTLIYRVDITNEAVLPSGQRIQYAGTLETAVRRPDGMRTRFEGEQRSTRSWFDGKTFTQLTGNENVYACWPSPGNLETLLDSLKEKLGFTPPLSLLLHEHVATSALARVQTGFTVGKASIGGVACTHLAFRGENSDWQVWVTEGAEPVIKRIVITRKTEPGSPQYSATFLEWNFSPALDDAAFAFTPPPGAAQCEFQPVKK